MAGKPAQERGRWPQDEEFRSQGCDHANALAQWKLAKIYANGDGVPRDDLKAYNYFTQIVANYDEDDPNRRDRAVVSSALVSLGTYNLNGIANSEIRPDPQRALQMFQFAATTFGDADAQYNLARMHLDGAGVDKDGREAIRWLYLAADKGHLQAQALLGQTLFTGREGVRPQRARGLMWLTLAREAAIDSKKDQWIVDLYDQAVASANGGDRQDALAYLENHLKRRNWRRAVPFQHGADVALVNWIACPLKHAIVRR